MEIQVAVVFCFSPFNQSSMVRNLGLLKILFSPILECFNKIAQNVYFSVQGSLQKYIQLKYFILFEYNLAFTPWYLVLGFLI